MKPADLFTTHQGDAAVPIPIKRTVTRTIPAPDRSPTEKGNEIWLLTLSDLLMLLMIFFVVLFGLTMQKQLLAGQQPKASANPTMAKTTAPVKTPTSASVPEPSPEKERSAALRRDLAAALHLDMDSQGLTITNTADVVTLTFPEKIIFDPGQAQLKPVSGNILNKVALFIKSQPGLIIEIQGYTDDTPINSARYPSNWELSVDRATQVAHGLIASGVSPETISVKGFGEYRPLVPNSSPEARQINRRVEVQFTLPPYAQVAPG
jgi:chemotaxis protein MotB